MNGFLRGGDAVDPSQLPPGLDIYWGYPDGRWRDYLEIAAAHPAPAVVMSTVVTAADDGDELDIETGDATDDQAPGWWARQVARGVTRPGFYRQVSGVLALTTVLAAARIPRSAYRLRSAHYDQALGAHICSPACGFGMPTTADATQHVDHGGWDETRALPSILPAPLPPTSGPVPVVMPKTKEFEMVLANDGHAQYFITVKADGTLLATPIATLADAANNELAQINAAIPNLGTVPVLIARLAKGQPV